MEKQTDLYTEDEVKDIQYLRFKRREAFYFHMKAENDAVKHRMKNAIDNYSQKLYAITGCEIYTSGT